MTKQTSAISLQSVNHVDRGNGVATALKRGFGRGYSLQSTCPSSEGIAAQGMVEGMATPIVFMLLNGMALRISRDLSLWGQALFGQVLFGRDWLDGYQLSDAAALRQASGRYRDGITVLTKH